MSALVKTLDILSSQTIGEKGHKEYGWSKTLEELTCQYFYQLVRTKDHSDLEKKLHTILSLCKGKEIENILYMRLMYKLIGQTRDIVSGKGEQQLAFMQLWIWYEYYPELVIPAFKQFVILKEGPHHPYGSWKDIKYFCNFIKIKTGGNENHPLILDTLKIAHQQLAIDEINYKNLQEKQGNFLKKVTTKSCEAPGVGGVSPPSRLSLLAKWFPRESSKKFGWIFNKMANYMYGGLLVTAKTASSNRKAKLKGKILLRKSLVKMNKHINTIQIQMCAKKWSSIDFNKVTSQTGRRNKLAFQNKTKLNEVRSTDVDRVVCAENYSAHLAASKADPTHFKVHGKRCNVYELVKDALSAINSDSIDSVNLQWQSNTENNKGLEKQPIISMVDTSSSMEVDGCIPLYNAIGLGIRTSELTHPAFKHRILTFDASPKWVNLEDCSDFVSKVKKVKDAAWGMTTNFYSAIRLILDAIIRNEIPPKDIENMILAVYSDMQIDTCKFSGPYQNMNTMFENITKMFSDVGLSSKFKIPYKPPHILFWNLRKTNGFPALTSQKNVTYLSGYSSALLNIFCNKGIKGLQESSPQDTLKELLSNSRYDILEEIIVNAFS